MTEIAAPPSGPLEWRAGAAVEFHDRVQRASSRHGVTRLADVTGLDRLGLPVWQATRPTGRSLSVHQGKGATHLSARTGALCEAIETDCAERCQADGPSCAFAALAESARAPDLSDYARDRSALPAAETTIDWCVASDLLTGGVRYLPYDLVSLDMTRERSVFGLDSTGLALGSSQAEAIEVALCEVIERDAVGAWDRSDPADRRSTRLSLKSVPFEWFGHWRARLEVHGVSMRAYAPAALTGLPTLIVSIAGAAEFGGGFRRFSGTASHPQPEVALFKAMAEAIQSRLTFIAGVRDDIMPSRYAASALPSDPAADAAGARTWEEIEPLSPGWEAVAGSLAALGYRQVVAKRLDDEADGFAVMKLFVPGLGSLRRRRRVIQ